MRVRERKGKRERGKERGEGERERWGGGGRETIETGFSNSMRSTPTVSALGVFTLYFSGHYYDTVTA